MGRKERTGKDGNQMLKSWKDDEKRELELGNKKRRIERKKGQRSLRITGQRRGRVDGKSYGRKDCPCRKFDDDDLMRSISSSCFKHRRVNGCYSAVE